MYFKIYINIRQIYINYIVKKKLIKLVFFIVFRKYLDVMLKIKKIKHTMLIKKISIILRSDSNPCASEK